MATRKKPVAKRATATSLRPQPSVAEQRLTVVFTALCITFMVLAYLRY